MTSSYEGSIWRVWHAYVLDDSLNTPPGAPTTGDAYIVANGGLGAWAGHDGEIMEWSGAAWASILGVKPPIGRAFIVATGAGGGLNGHDGEVAFIQSSWIPAGYVYSFVTPDDGRTSSVMGDGTQAGYIYTYSTGAGWLAISGGSSLSPSGTVVSETSFGQAANAGVAATYSKGDHTHGTPTEPLQEFHQVGTSPWEVWYPFGEITNAVPTGAYTVAANYIYAYPFKNGRAGATLDRIAIGLITGDAGKYIRLGIYQSTSATNLYPGSLIVGSAALDVSVSFTAVFDTISAVLPAGILWASWISDGAPRIRSGVYATQERIFGSTSTLSANFYNRAYKSLAYGALPATFPTGATFDTYSDRVVVWGRHSA